MIFRPKDRQDTSSSVKSDNNAVAVGGNVINSIINTGLSEEESERLKRIERLIAQEKGVDASPLHAVLEKLGENNVPLDEIPARLSEAADRLIKLQDRLRTLPDGITAVSEIQNEALSLISKGQLDEAEAAFIRGIQALHDSRVATSHAEAKLLCDAAEVNQLQQKFTDSSVKYQQAAKIYSSIDAEKQFETLLSAAEALEISSKYSLNKNELIEALHLVRQARDVGEAHDDLRQMIIADLQSAIYLRLISLQESSNDSLHTAIGKLEEALKCISDNSMTDLTVSLQIELGNTLNILGKREQENKNIFNAITAHETALQNLDREEDPLNWMRAKSGLGSSYLSLGRRNMSVKSMEDAVRCNREALEVAIEHDFGDFVAMSHNNVATSLLALAETIINASSESDKLNKARIIFGEARTEYIQAAETHRDNKRTHLFAGSLMGLGHCLAEMDIYFEGSNYIEDAINAFQNAKHIYYEHGYVYEYANCCSSIGNAYIRLASHNNWDQSLIDVSLSSHNDAVSSMNRDVSPIDWSMMQGNKAKTLMHIALHKKCLSTAIEAQTMLIEVIDILEGKHASFAANFGKALANISNFIERSQNCISSINQ